MLQQERHGRATDAAAHTVKLNDMRTAHVATEGVLRDQLTELHLRLADRSLASELDSVKVTDLPSRDVLYSNTSDIVARERSAYDSVLPILVSTIVLITTGLDANPLCQRGRGICSAEFWLLQTSPLLT